MLRREPPQWVDFDHARLELARLKLSDSGTVDVLFARAVEICSRALNVDRVGVWSLDPSIPGLCCVHLLDRKEPAAAGERLRQSDLGRYAHALMERRFIASSDVRADATMADLAAEYFAPRSIVSTLDVPLYRDGEVVGVLCHEHRGSPRVWTDEEGDFAISVADMLAHALTTSDLVAALEQLREEELARQDALRTEALGRVARGLTHDLGNSLQSVLLQAEHLLRVADDPERVREVACTIRRRSYESSCRQAAAVRKRIFDARERLGRRRQSRPRAGRLPGLGKIAPRTGEMPACARPPRRGLDRRFVSDPRPR